MIEHDVWQSFAGLQKVREAVESEILLDNVK
jgi:hypothetical protein